MRNNIWFVTGTTTGVGYVLVRRLLDEGYRVAATSRTREKLEELFGPERLRQTLDSLGALPMHELLLSVKGRIDRFAGSAEQFDDITMLGIEYTPEAGGAAHG